DSYPAAQQNQIRAMLGESLKAVFSQRLLPRADGTGMVLAYELLLGSTQLANLIKDGKTFQIPNIMQMGKSQGLRTMDDTLLELLKAGTITLEVAHKNALNAKAFPPLPAGGAPAAAGHAPAPHAPAHAPAAPAARPAAAPAAPAAARPAGAPAAAPRPGMTGAAPPRPPAPGAAAARPAAPGAPARPTAPPGAAPRPPAKPEAK